MGASLLAKALSQPASSAQTHRHRQQGWLPQGYVLPIRLVPGADQCGSLPCKRWRWVSQHLRHRHTAIASRAGSHRVMCCPSGWCLAQINVGACPASDGGGSVNIFGTDSPLSPAGLAPTGLCVVHNIRAQRRSLWELALQAMAVGQPTSSAQTHRHRQQGWLPQVCVSITTFESSADPCGSLPCKRWRRFSQPLRHRLSAFSNALPGTC